MKRRSAACWEACAARTALLSCAARKGSIRTYTTVGRRSSWRRARNGSPVTRRVRRPRTRSRSSRLRRASSRRPWLRQLKAVDSLAGLLQELGRHRLAVLGAEYLRWDRSISEKNNWTRSLPPQKIHSYTSARRILLSVDSSSTQSRRVRIDPGTQPPKSPPTSTTIYVDGRQLEEPPRKDSLLPPQWPRRIEIDFPDDHP